MDLRHVAHVDHRSVHLFERYVVEATDRLNSTVETDGIVLLADPRLARGKSEVLGIDGIADVAGRKSLGLKRLRIDIHHDLPRLAAVWRRERRALYNRKLLAHVLNAVIPHRGLGEWLAAQ